MKRKQSKLSGDNPSPPPPEQPDSRERTTILDVLKNFRRASDVVSLTEKTDPLEYEAGIVFSDGEGREKECRFLTRVPTLDEAKERYPVGSILIISKELRNVKKVRPLKASYSIIHRGELVINALRHYHTPYHELVNPEDNPAVYEACTLEKLPVIPNTDIALRLLGYIHPGRVIKIVSKVEEGALQTTYKRVIAFDEL